MITADTKEFTLLAADLARAAAILSKPVDNELRDSAKAIRATGRELVRKKSGRTARSITFSKKKRGLQYEIGPRWFVGRFLEFGTVRMRAYPFMQPAANQHVADMADRVAKAAAENTFTGRSGPLSLI